MPQAIKNEATTYGRKNPFPAKILKNKILNGANSAKETRHIELSLEGSGFEYEPGDVLAVIPENATDVVQSIFEITGFDPATEVQVKTIGTMPLSEAFKKHLDITGITRKVAGAWQEISQSSELEKLLSEDAKEEFKDWLWGRQLIDLLENFPAEKIEPQAFVNILRKLLPRLYSIASSLKAHPGEVHLTVAAVRYEAHGRERKGVASTYLSDDAVEGAKALSFMHFNKNFRLPESDDTPIIMVGPGTGVAPFRAFTEERAARGAKGESWLFFGDQHVTDDFLYEDEWKEYLEKGQLTRLSTAFSRDQEQKIYVQHRMLENGAELWQWLEKGAHFYVCGDASRMAADVHNALLEIIATHGGKSEEEASEYLTAIKKDKRYQRDVY